jgi:nucleoside-diphosphate-sugar epimerase
MDTVSLRYFNIFGPRQSASSAYAAVIAAFATALLKNERPRIYGDGEQSRDFTHVNNAVHANLLAGRKEGRLGGAVMNVATGKRVTVAELARGLAGKPELTPVYLPARAGDVLHSQATLEVARRVLGYEVVTGLEEGLGETLEWYRGEVMG